MRRSDFLATALAATVSPGAPSVLRLDALPAGHDIDPYRDPERGIDEIAWLYGDGLVGWSNGPVPLLAAALPTATDGGKRYRYRLRDVRWHDGDPVVSLDVVDAFNAIRNGFWGTFEPYRSVRQIVPIGTRSFDVELHQPKPGFVRSFFGPYGRAAVPLLKSRIGALPIGTGPFMVRARTEFNSWKLQRWDASPRGRPRIDRIDLRYLFLPQTDYIALRSGESDMALPLPGRFPPSPAFRRVRRTTGSTLIIFNAAGPFGDFQTRRALVKTLDISALQRAYDPNRKKLLATFRLGEANDERLTQLLAHEEAAGEELRWRLNGHEVRVVTMPGTTVDVAMNLIRQTLVNELGISVRMVPVTYGGLYGPMSPLRRGDFDLAVNSYAYTDEADLAADWSSAAHPGIGGNFAQWSDPDLDRAITARRRESAFRRLYDTLAAIPLSQAYEDIGVGPRVCGVPVPPPMVPATYSCVGWRIC